MRRAGGAAVSRRWQAFRALPAPVRRRFLVMVAPWLLAFALGFPVLWVQFGMVAQAPVWRVREGLLDESAEILRRTLDSLQHDVLFLGDMSSQLPRSDLNAASPMARLFVTFAKTAGAYDQVRWVGQDGHEKLRVNGRHGNPLLISPEELQDKGDRPYFRDTVNMPPGSVYVSEVDLNIEHHALERPFEPTLRVATPLYENDVAQGVIVINYRVSRLFSRLNDLAERQGLNVMLMNDAGYWLQGPTPDNDWAWQLGLPEHTVAHTDPALWQALKGRDSGRYSDDTGYWVFRRMKLNMDAGADIDSAGPVINKLGITILVQGSREQAAQASLGWKLLLGPFMAVVLFLMLRYCWQTVNGLIEEEHRAAELRAANHALRRANENLRSVQADLSRAERLSSLGLMVAGVAHELNTPLGSASLSLSTLRQAVSTLQAKLDAGLRKSDLQAFLSNARMAADLSETAVQRAAGIVQRFKQVAVDRTSMEQRLFDLAEVVMDSDTRIRQWNAGGSVALRLELESGLGMNSYPGPLEQVVTNLLGNALTHAFTEQDNGTITLQAHADGASHVIVRVMDDGRGIDARHLPHIFDPFFTTHRHAGGTGLGLHIASQLVTEILGGTITVQSRTTGEPRGTSFILRLPRVAPTHRSDAASRD